MKAVTFSQHGGPEVLQYTDVTDPLIKADEVLVEVRACALNHLDVWVRGGLPGIKTPLPHILGNDVAGVVREAGELVPWVKPGDEVMIQPGSLAVIAGSASLVATTCVTVTTWSAMGVMVVTLSCWPSRA
jgi:NADPH:quinone reductase-like Zn-dependent oxidoreductase